ncbi:MAG: hypothetical protein INR70_25955 [Parafilimonas terrae]|nr:hypothetical protein [Parafilimonas terrae]
MPRWNRREKPDYRHLRDATPESALVNAIESPTYGDGHDHRLLAGIQARLVTMWGQHTVIARDNLVVIHEEHRARDPGFFGHGRDWEETFPHDVVGNLVGWGLRLGVLEEAEWFGAPGYRMVRRVPLFERMGDGKWRRLDAEGVREMSARGAAQREAYRIRHAEKIAPEVARLVEGLFETSAPVPKEWFTRFPDQFARLSGLAKRVADARPTFEDAHRGMHLADQKR